jgi:hypothetical protein
VRARGLKSPDPTDAVVAAFRLGAGYVNSSNRQLVRAPPDPMAALNAHYDGRIDPGDMEPREWSRAGLSDPGY